MRGSKELFHIPLSGPIGRVIAILWSLIIIYGYLSLGGYRVGINLITGDWITHSNEQYCYSLEYPGRWKLFVSGDEGWHGGVRPYQRAMLSDPKPYLLGGIALRVDQVPMTEPSLEDVAAWRKGYEPAASSLESVTADGKPALMRTILGSSSKTTEVYIARETDGLILSVTSKANYHEDALEIFQQIVDEVDYWECSS